MRRLLGNIGFLGVYIAVLIALFSVFDGVGLLIRMLVDCCFDVLNARVFAEIHSIDNAARGAAYVLCIVSLGALVEGRAVSRWVATLTTLASFFCIWYSFAAS